jgi:hypothetical protein
MPPSLLGKLRTLLWGTQTCARCGREAAVSEFCWECHTAVKAFLWKRKTQAVSKAGPDQKAG